MLSTALLSAAEVAINAVLELDAVTIERLNQLSGHVIAIELEGLGQTLYIRPHSEGLDLMGDYEGVVDASLCGTPMALLNKSEEVIFKGDIELGQELQRIISQMDIDWEEHLSHLTGDIIAHQIGNGFRTLTGWGRHNRKACERDISEYLRYETDSLPLEREVTEHMRGVDKICNDLKTLETRIDHLVQSVRPISS